MRGYDIGGQIDMASGQYSGPTLSTDSLGRSISSGFAAGSQLGTAVNKAGEKKKPSDPNTPSRSPPPVGEDPNDMGFPGTVGPNNARGGRIKHTAGPRIGKDDGLIPAQKGEYVVRKSAVKKLGTRVLNQVNKGRLPQGKAGRGR
jgi:hypothetical protein